MLNWLDPDRYRLLSCSRPGYLGTPLRSGRTFEQQADLFAALLDALGVDRAAVVTLSAGGPAGYLLAARHPDRVSALVALSSVTGRYDMPETAGRFAQALFLSHRGQQLTQVITRRWPAWLLRQTFQGTAHYTARQLAEQMQYALGSPDAVVFLRALIATLNPYRRQVRSPILVVHGTTTPTSSSVTVSGPTRTSRAPTGSGSRTAHTWGSGWALTPHTRRTPHGNSWAEPCARRQASDNTRDQVLRVRPQPRPVQHDGVCHRLSTGDTTSSGRGCSRRRIAAARSAAGLGEDLLCEGLDFGGPDRVRAATGDVIAACRR